MSTNIKINLINATIILIIFLLNSPVFSQDIETKIKLISPDYSKLQIEGKFLENKNLIEKNWSFLQNYADAKNLGKKVTDLQLFDDSQNEINYKKFADGEFVSEQNAQRFSYKLDISVLQNATSNAHISWANKSQGILMLNDLFPKLNGDKTSAKITFELPNDWKILTNEKGFNANTFLVEDLENAVFVIGKSWRKKEILLDKHRLSFVIFDKWQFEDKLAYEMAKEIFKEYAKLFGGIPFTNSQIVLMNFPIKTEINRWRAETRGTNITILSSQTLAPNLAKQRLHEQLRHEIFHLWIPNSLNLSGDYAWFYEGFAVYQALKTGVWLGQIRFDDFLNTLEQAYFLTQKRNRRISLIEDSKMRWNGNISSVYAKGLLVAFLCEVAILRQSKGKKDLKTIFRRTYRKYSKNAEKTDANTSILKVLQQSKELDPIIKKYINGKEKFEWAKYLSALGIENIGNDINANLRLKSKLSGRQKTLLKKLGYNRRRNFIRQKVYRNVN